MTDHADASGRLSRYSKPKGEPRWLFRNTAQGGMQHGSMDEKWIAGIVRATVMSVMVLALSGV